MKLDSMQILTDLIDEFGEGEVILMHYDHLPEQIELRLIVKHQHASHRFSFKELKDAKVDVFNRIYKQMFTLLKKEVSLNVED